MSIDIGSIHISIHQITPLLAIVAGIGVLAWPKMMRYILGAYLIAIGVIQLLQ
jgi:hypothetical protein